MSSADRLDRLAPVAPFTFELGWASGHEPHYCGFHAHEHIEMVHHVDRHGTTAYGSPVRSLRFEADSVVIYPPGMPHDQTSLSAGEDQCVLVSTPGQQSPITDIVHIAAPIGPALRADFAELTRPIHDLSPHAGAARSLRASALLAGLLALRDSTSSDAAVAPRGSDSAATQAHGYIAENARTIVRMEQVARHVGLSYDRLRHVFRDAYGMSMKQWLITVRMQRAQTLLRHTGLPQKAIAAQCGYRSDRYFCADFRRTAGCSPGRYRKRTCASGQ